MPLLTWICRLTNARDRLLESIDRELAHLAPSERATIKRLSAAPFAKQIQKLRAKLRACQNHL